MSISNGSQNQSNNAMQSSDDILIEEGLVLCLLRHPIECADTIPLLEPERFLSAHLGLIAASIKALNQSGRVPDWRLVFHDVRSRVPLETLTALLAQSAPVAESATHYLDLHRQSFGKRKLMMEASQFVTDAGAANGNLPAVIGKLSEAIREVQDETVAKNADLASTVTEAIWEVDEVHSGAIRTIPTGFSDLDRLLGGGLRYGETTVIGARTQTGKTSFMLNVVNRIVGSTPVLFFSFETSPTQVVKNLVSIRKGIETQALSTGNVLDQALIGRPRWIDGCMELQAAAEKARFEIVPRPQHGMDFIEAQARKFFKERGAGLCIIDTINRIYERHKRFESRQKELAYVMNRIDQLSEELNAVLVVIAQLNRKTDEHGGPPRLSDLKDCGDIEEIADNVLLLHSKERPEGAVVLSGQENWGDVDASIAKQRIGPTGCSVEFVFRKEVLTFFLKDTTHA